MVKKIILIISLLVTVIAAKANEQQLDIKETTLENGIKVIVLNLKTKGVISGGVGYYVGAADDPRTCTGISHVLEHMMFQGTKNLSGQELKKIIFIYNKFSNAFTSYDITFYVLTCNKDLLDVDLKIEADRMENLQLKRANLAKEKEVVIEERKMRTESQPRTNHLEEAVWKATYLFSTYSYPVIGYLDQIRSCGIDELKAHYNKYYVPNNAFVLLVGDITIEEAVAKVKKYFGHIKRGIEVKRDRVIDPENTGLRYTVDHESDQISVHDLEIIYRFDRSLVDTLRKLTIVEMCSEILSSGENSILHKKIVDEKEFAYTIDSLIDVRAFDKGRINISMVMRENKDDKIVEDEVNSIITDYVEKYLTKSLFEKKKQKMLDKYDMDCDDPALMCSYMLSCITSGYKVEDFKNIKNIINGITFEEVRDAAKSIFNKENRFMRIYSHPKGM